MQDEVSYVLDCAAEAWWAHNPQVPGFRMDENGTLGSIKVISPVEAKVVVDVLSKRELC